MLSVASRSLRRRFPYGPFMLVGATLAVVVGPQLRSRVSVTDGTARAAREPPCVKHWRHAALAHGRGVPRPSLTAILEGCPPTCG